MRDIIERLSAEIQGSADRIRVGVETDEDEAVLIGTRLAFLKLARSLIDAAERTASTAEFAGTRVQWTTATTGVMDSWIRITAECRCETDEDAQRVYEHFESLNPR